MSLTASEMTPADIAAVTRNNGNDGMGFGEGGAWWWIIILFLFCFNGGWGNGFGGGFGGGTGGAGFQGYATRADINEGFALNNLQSGITAIQQGICDSTYALNNTITSGFNASQMGIMQGFNGLQAQLADCCCTTQRAIDSVNYNMATQTCAIQNTIQNTTRDILESQNNSTRAILDYLAQDKIATLQAENQSLKFAASQSEQNAFIAANQSAQTAELIRRLGADCPVPAYVVNAPTPVAFPVNACGQAYAGYNGCGCN